MQTLQTFLGNEYRKYFRTGLLLLTAYFFLGVSEGSFLFFDNVRDTSLNFLFTLICVFSNWALFKWLYRQSADWNEKYAIKGLGSLLQVTFLMAYTIALNWIYIELIWQEKLSNTAFFPVVLPLALLLFLAWTLGYPFLVSLNEGPDQKAEMIEAKKGRQVVFCALDETLGFVVENKVVFLLHKNGQRLLMEKTLTELEEELTIAGFFRANRQILISPKAVEAYKVVENDRLEVQLIKALNGQICFVSRYKAAAFRKWLNDHPSFG